MIRTASTWALAALLLASATPAFGQRPRRGQRPQEEPALAEPATPTPTPTAASGNAPIEIALTPAPEAREPSGPVVSFTEAIRIAERTHPDALTALAAVDRASGAVTEAWGNFLPELSAEARYRILDDDRAVTRNQIADDGSVARTRTVLEQSRNPSGRLEAVMPILKLENFSKLSSARRSREAAEHAEIEARRLVRVAVAKAYFAILSAHSLRETAMLARTNAEQHLRDAEVRMRSGIGIRIEVTRAALAVEKEQEKVVSAQVLEEEAYEALATLLERDTPFRVAQPRSLPEPNQAVRALIDRAFENRHDLREAERKQEAEELLASAESLSFLPSFDVTAGIDFTDYPNPNNGATRWSWNIVFAAQVPLFEGARFGRLSGQQAKAREAEIAAREIRRTIMSEVRTAHRAWRAGLTKITTARRQVELARESLALAEVAYRRGASTDIEVVDAQKDMGEAEANLVIETYETQLALINLLLAAGLPF